MRAEKTEADKKIRPVGAIRPAGRMRSAPFRSLDESNRHARLEDAFQAVLEAVDALLIGAGDDLERWESGAPSSRFGIPGRGTVRHELQSIRAEVGAWRQLNVEQVAEGDRVDASRRIGQTQTTVEAAGIPHSGH